MKLDIKYYFSVFLRRSPYFLVVVAVFASIGLTVAILLPPEYEAQATLLVESEQIPENLASSTVNTATSEQLRIIQQRLRTRENLISVANRLNLYEPEDGAPRPSASAIVADMRERVSFNQISTSQSRRRGPEGATILEISYRGRSAGTVAEVANEFVTLVLQENAQLRTEQAEDTLSFFRQEVDRLGSELDEQSVRLIEFQNEAGIAVPSNLSFLRSRLDDLRNQRSDNRQSIVALEDQKRRLEELFRITGDIGSGEAASPLQEELDSVRQQLNDALLVYSETNPRVAMLRARVSQLEERMQTASRAEVATADPEEVEEASGNGSEYFDGREPSTEREVRFAAEMEDIDRRIEVLRSEIEVFSSEISEIEDQIADVPSNGVTLAKLQRDFDNVQEQYNEAVGRLSIAATGQRIELLSKGQRTSVIEQATRPERPTKPNRPIIAAAGVGAGIFVGLALIVLMEFLNRSIRRPVELTNRLGITPLAVLPYIRTKREIAFRRMIVLGVVGFFVVMVPLGLFTIHTLFMPLDPFIEALFNRVGLSIIG